MDCDACEANVANQGASIKKVACSYCFEGRTPSTVDDGLCISQIYLSTNPFTGEKKSINLCSSLRDGIEGKCPVQPLCAPSCASEKEKKFGDGTCDAECYGCLDWQQDTYFDGGDCETDDWTKLLSAGQTWSGTIHCTWPAGGFNRQMQEADLPSSIEIENVDGQFVSGRMMVDWKPEGEGMEEMDILKATQLPNEQVTMFFSVGSKISSLDGSIDYDDDENLVYTGTAEVDPDEVAR